MIAGVSLTLREIETIELVAVGRSNKQIAAEMRVSIKCVEKFRQCAMDKLNRHCTAALVHFAIKNKLVGLEGETSAGVQNAWRPE